MHTWRNFEVQNIHKKAFLAKFKVEKIDGEYEVFYNPISVFVPNIIKNFLGD